MILLRRWLMSVAGYGSPRAFLAGFALGLVVLSVLGRHVSSENLFQGFQRLHMFVNTTALYYPTASQLQALAADTVASD